MVLMLSFSNTGIGYGVRELGSAGPWDEALAGDEERDIALLDIERFVILYPSQ